MSVTLPGIGRNGLVNSVRKLSGSTNPGYRDVDSTAEFVAGMVAKLAADGDGNPVLQVADNTSSSGEVIGLFFCHKTTSFYRPIVDEVQTFGTAPNTSTVVYLDHANLKGSAGTYLKVADATGAEYNYGGGNDFTCSYTNGTITRSVGSTSIGASDPIYVSYYYEDPNLSGIDQTLGSGKAATLEDRGEVATLVYDTDVAYTLGGSIYINADGYPTSANGTAAIGKVTKVPTSADPELHFKLQV